MCWNSGVPGLTAAEATLRSDSMNAIAERWIGGCRRELLDRTPYLEPGPSAAASKRLRDPP